MPLFDEGGGVAQVVILFRDVTAELSASEQVAAERDELRRTQARLHAFLENAPVIAFIKDLDGKHLVVNAEAMRAFGLTGETALGRTARDLFGDAYADAAEAQDREVLER